MPEGRWRRGQRSGQRRSAQRRIDFARRSENVSDVAEKTLQRRNWKDVPEKECSDFFEKIRTGLDNAEGASRGVASNYGR